ncbi:MAG: hypothetical protein ACK56W_20690 [Pirellula sp.]|jgi:hypothetical protein|nr:hypothetical protein [Pirellula sp.]
MHVAPLVVVKLGPKSIYKFRYRLVVGNQDRIAEQLDALWTAHADEQAELTQGPTQGQ